MTSCKETLRTLCPHICVKSVSAFSFCYLTWGGLKQKFCFQHTWQLQKEQHLTHITYKDFKKMTFFFLLMLRGTVHILDQDPFSENQHFVPVSLKLCSLFEKKNKSLLITLISHSGGGEKQRAVDYLETSLCDGFNQGMMTSLCPPSLSGTSHFSHTHFFNSVQETCFM